MIYNYRDFLLEKRNLVGKIKKFANVPLIYKWADKQDSNLSLWISDQIVNKLVKKVRSKSEKMLPLLKKYLKGIEINEKEKSFFDNSIEQIQHTMERDLRRVLDYVNSPLHSNRPKLKNLDLKGALEVSEKWHDQIKDLDFVIEEEEGTVIMKFPDGFYWIDLESNSNKDEAKAMGHCANTNDSSTLLSLRRYQQPHVTISYNESDNVINQIKGKGNTKPIEKYHKYIVDLIIKLDVGGFETEYDRSQDFDVEDLDEELREKLEEHNPDYIENSRRMTDSEIEDIYKDMLEDNWEEELEYMGRFIWQYVDDDAYIKNHVDMEMDFYTGDGFDDYFDTDHVINWINAEVDFSSIVEFFEEWFDKKEAELREEYVDDEDNEDFIKKLKEIEEKREKDSDDNFETELDATELHNFLDMRADIDDLVRDHLEGLYDSAEDVYSIYHGNSADVDSEFITNELLDFIDEKKLIDDLMYQTDIEDMRYRVE
jgi:hypothetical protein